MKSARTLQTLAHSDGLRHQVSMLLVDPIPLARAPISRDATQWLVSLRWGAIAAQLFVIAVSALVLKLPLPLPALLGIVGLEALSNYGLWFYARRFARPVSRASMLTHGLLAFVLASDFFFLTALLMLTGGASNPFNFLYLVHLALSALVLPRRWVWALFGLAVGCFGGLFLVPHHHGIFAGTHGMQLHLYGMWVAFAVAGAFIVYFVRSISVELQHRQAEQKDAEARNQRLASLATLSAGAAHELRTPLATIAIAVDDMQNELVEEGRHEGALQTVTSSFIERPTWIGDLALIQGQVQRCHEILSQLAQSSGQTEGEQIYPFTLGDLWRETVKRIPQHHAAHVSRSDWDDALLLTGPLQSLSRALANVINNGLELSPSVQVATLVTDGVLRLWVMDDGPGIDEGAHSRIVEPFFSTKPNGLGLGLYLARLTLHQMGGELYTDGFRFASPQIKQRFASSYGGAWIVLQTPLRHAGV